MIFLTLAILVMALAVLGALVGLCAFATLSLVVGLALSDSKLQRWAPFLIWIPSLMAAFAVSFTVFSFCAMARSWAFPSDPIEYFIALGVGEVLAVAAGIGIAFRARKKHGFQNTKSS